MSEAHHKEAQILLQKSKDDAYAFSRLSDDPRIRFWTLGFHVQQAVEKAIKAVLLNAGIQYPFTHDLETLLKVLKKEMIPHPADAENIPRLSPFATLLRYEDDVDEDSACISISADWLKSIVASTIKWAEENLNKYER